MVLGLKASLTATHVLVIDDGSSDRTSEEALAAGACVIRLPVNLGVGGAVQTGYKYAIRHGFDVAVQVDADGQHDPRALPDLLTPLHSNQADLVIGSRWLTTSDTETATFRSPFLRRIGMLLLSCLVSRISGARYTDTTSGFRAAGPAAVRAFAQHYPQDYPEVEAVVLATRMHLRVVEVPVHMHPRKSGQSSITPLKSLVYMLKVALAVLMASVRAT